MRGVPVGTPQRIDLSGRRGLVTTVPVTLDPALASGLYAARLDGPSGHLGFAPIIVRPPAPVQRVAIVLPTTTWQAYNYYDRNGDGFGDTWYSLFSHKRIDLNRPHLREGVPERFRSYEVQFLHWLASRGHAVDTYGDEDIELFASPEALRACLRPDRLPGPHGVRHAAAVRPHPRLPRSRRPPDLPLGQQLLPSRQAHGRRGAAHRRVARRGEARVGPARQPVPRERQRPAAGAVHGHRCRRGSLAVRRHGALERLAVRQVRHRDRRHHAELAARHPGARADPGSPRAGADRRR